MRLKSFYEAFTFYLSGCHIITMAIDSFTVSLHSTNGRHLPAVRALQRDCQLPLKIGGNSHWSHEPIRHCIWGVIKSIFASADHTASNAANYKPCLITHWQSYCHQVRTVKQSRIGRNCGNVFMVLVWHWGLLLWICFLATTKIYLNKNCSVLYFIIHCSDVIWAP